MTKACQRCGATITGRAKAHIWTGTWTVCTTCKNALESDAESGRISIEIAGRANQPWLVHDGRQQFGPYTTAELISYLATRRVDWMWNVWRDGMKKWTQIARLFVTPELGRGRIELRDHGQGDGTYRPGASD